MLPPRAGKIDIHPLKAVRPGSLPLPDTVRAAPGEKLEIRWSYVLSLLTVHALAGAACWPWLFSWAGVIACGAGLYVFGTLGINVGYHRLLTHRSFACPVWVERVLALLGVCCLEEGPGRWVAVHRRHHQHSDERPDPHSPLVAFFWGHVGWLLVGNRATDGMALYQGYAKDLMTKRFYMRLERRYTWVWVYAAHAALIAAATFGVSWLVTRDVRESGRLTASMVVWGVLVRTVLVWHITWSVNSLSHLFGYQSHDTGENSMNNWLVALVSNGEGWHNNHHADPRSAAHGQKWWELDVSYLTILAMEKVGLAWKVMKPGRRG